MLRNHFILVPSERINKNTSNLIEISQIIIINFFFSLF